MKIQKKRFRDDSLDSYFSKSEIDLLWDLRDIKENRKKYLYDTYYYSSSIGHEQAIIFNRIDDFIVTMGILLNGNKLNLIDKKYKLLKKVVKKVVVIRYKNILQNKKEYKDLGCLVF
tara:strand:- start:961 stop:1311 length:351 start_codon:yes stop_codon:yes gene_type:complete